MRWLARGWICLLLAWPVAADEPTAAQSRIAAALAALPAKLTVLSVQPVAGLDLYEVLLADGTVLYSTADAGHVIEGDLYRLSGGHLESLTEASRTRLRRELLAAVPPSEMIVFSPRPPQQVRAVVHVFTDIDCGYCQRLHQEVPALNAQGVEVRYLAWPRAPAGTDSYQRMVTAWCAADRQQALTRLKQRQSVPPRLCTTHPLPQHLRLGSLLGVRGTPALVLESGELQPGYLPAVQLLPKLLGPR